ncbi:MAG: lipid II flippase MurJ, partial [Dehalococcoidia bacterium]|nr:lipid II flippase MurJ [Dehalococcoidia bacterium]
MVAGQGTLAAVKARPRGTLLKASVVLLAVAAVSKLMTLAADAFVAGRFGLSVDTDAYLLGIGLIGAALGAPSETLRLSVIPLCGQHLREGRRREAAGAAALVLLIAVLLGTAIALTILAAGPWLAAIAAPGFGSDGHRTLLRLLWLLTLMPVVGLAMAVLLGVLHAQLRFGVPALVGIGIAASIVGMGLLLGGSLGVAALVLGHVVGTTIVTLLLALMAWDMFADGAVLRQAWRELKPFVRLALPTGLAITMVSLGAVIERALASSTGAGNVAALGFAIKLVTQVAVVSQSIWTPLTPLMTASGASVDDRGDNRLAVFSLKLVLLVMMPATALLIALREPLVAVIFERGAFTAADTAKTATLLALHSGSLVGEGLFMVSVAVLLSLHDVWTRVIASVLLIAAKVALSLALLPFLGVAGIALAA